MGHLSSKCQSFYQIGRTPRRVHASQVSDQELMRLREHFLIELVEVASMTGQNLVRAVGNYLPCWDHRSRMNKMETVAALHSKNSLGLRLSPRILSTNKRMGQNEVQLIACSLVLASILICEARDLGLGGPAKASGRHSQDPGRPLAIQDK